MSIKVEDIHFAGEDERGLTGEIDSMGRGGKFILAYRVAGSISGNHYHKGLSEMKNPEVVFLLEGEVLLKYGDVLDGQLQKKEAVRIGAPARIGIPINTWHEMHFEEASCFFELNSFEEGDKDTFRL